MEKKNMDKIDILYDYVKDNRNKLEERIRNLNESFYTDDMKKILTTIMQHNSKYFIYISDIRINFFDSYCNFGFYVNRYHLTLCNSFQKNYNTSMISLLECEIRDEKKLEERLSFIEDNMEEIILKISNKYKEFSEGEGNKLDELLSQIDYDVAPTKHLKITVEWV